WNPANDWSYTGLTNTYTTTQYIPVYQNGALIYGQEPSTNNPPAVAIISPAGGASFTAPAEIEIQAAASDGDGAVSKVEFYNGSSLLGTDTTVPYSHTWGSVPAGSYTLTAKAYDDRGASAVSAPVSITVNPPQTDPPTCSITSPADGATYSAPAEIVIAAAASDSDGTVSKVEFFNGATKLGEDASPPYQYEWRDVPAGSYTLTARAIDNLGATGVSAPVQIVVSSDNAYIDRFLALWDDLHEPANGYFSPQGVPYHAVETLIVEAPDHGHETTSEAYSYWIWLEAMYGRLTGDWTKLSQAWSNMEQYIIPTHQDQPTNDFYNPSKPATYAPEWPLPDYYPSQLDFSVPVGADPIFNELKTTYGTADIYGMHWLLDVDNWYGYGTRGDGTTAPSYINTFQRGPQESVWETVPHPSWETFNWGGPNGYLDLFIKDNSYARQWRYTNAPDADARAIQAMYWAKIWADEQGDSPVVDALVPKAAKMGDYLRYSFFDKYFKVLGATSPGSPGGTGYDSAHYLLSWYYAWGGATDPSAGWAWRIGSSFSHFGYQNPMTAWVLGNVPAFKPLSPNGARDWNVSLTRQLEFYRWLQSAEGAIAGGCTNSWEGQYAAPPPGSATFYAMAFDSDPVYHDPPSNNWFGYQAWSMERVAEYYYATGDAKARMILDKWVAWVKSVTRLNADGTYAIPATLNWSGQPGMNWDAANQNWNAEDASFNAHLHVTVVDYTQDVGIAAAVAKTLAYYAAATGDTAARDLAQQLLDRMWTSYRDEKGVSVPEARADYDRFFDQTVYIPAGWSGTMPNGDPIAPGVTFLEIRSKYLNDPDFAKVQTAYQNGTDPVFNYHRFWAQADIALANAVFGLLFPGI
ncbi:MAG: glycoside hydrolase family 48 protein, partial [Bacteroidota bacterium]